MKTALYLLGVFCFLHIYHDYLQIKGVRNWFTKSGHICKFPRYEKLGMVILGTIGLISLYFAFAI